MLKLQGYNDKELTSLQKQDRRHVAKVPTASAAAEARQFARNSKCFMADKNKQRAGFQTQSHFCKGKKAIVPE
jgi:hypothetical protein